MISTDINALLNPQAIAGLYIAGIILYTILIIIYHLVWGKQKIMKPFLAEKSEKEAMNIIRDIIHSFQKQNNEINRLREQTYEGNLAQEVHQAKQKAAQRQNRLYPNHG